MPANGTFIVPVVGVTVALTSLPLKARLGWVDFAAGL
jgi:hypothetical protein